MSISKEFDLFIDGLDDAEEPKTITGNQCKTCVHFTSLNISNAVIKDVGECSLWEEGMDPTDTCDAWEE